MVEFAVSPGEHGFWLADGPSLAGCVSQGKSRAEALMNIREAIDGCVAALDQDGIPVPGEEFQSLLVAVCVVPQPVGPGVCEGPTESRLRAAPAGEPAQGLAQG